MKYFSLFCFLLFVNSNIFSQENELVPFIAKTISIANLRAQPDGKSEKKETLKIGSNVYIFSENETDGYLKAIDIKSNKLGWIKSSAVKKIKDLPLSNSSGFQETGISAGSDTEISISNKSSSTITLIVGENQFSLEPFSTTNETTSNGTLLYTASAPGVIPSSGKYEFKKGYKYNWTFTIVTKRR